MRIEAASANNHKRVFEVDLPRGRYSYPYALCEPSPSADDPLVGYWIDAELAEEALTYRLASGAEGTLHLEQVLDHNKDPEYLREMLLYRLSLEAQRQLEASPLSKREVARRLGTSPAQLYRLLDQTNCSKSVDSVIALLTVLGCDVDITVNEHVA